VLRVLPCPRRPGPDGPPVEPDTPERPALNFVVALPIVKAVLVVGADLDIDVHAMRRAESTGEEPGPLRLLSSTDVDKFGVAVDLPVRFATLVPRHRPLAARKLRIADEYRPLRTWVDLPAGVHTVRDLDLLVEP